MQVERPLRPTEDETQTLPKIAPDHDGKSIDAALARQREDWLTGVRIPIADRLRACPGICADPAQAAELIYHEFLLRRDCGETPDWDTLLREFPEYAVQLQRFREADQIVDRAFGPSGPAMLGGYDLLEEVGRGGMGVVYRARERNLDRTVAIKRIRGGALAADDATERFLREAKAVSRLNHPNIVHIYRVSDCDEEPFIALEFVEGPTLAQRISGTPLAPQLAGTIGAAVARAIQHAHEHGIIHRDLKPANILLPGSPEMPVPKVTDFGAAKSLDHASDTERTQFLGTPSYMAPEQVDPKWGAIGRLTDVYGIGTLLYETLTGRPPFRADSVGETLRQVVETQPVSPRLLNPSLPRDLETVCLKCLQKESGRRYESAAALADDLERFLAGQPIHARPIGPVARSWMWCRRKPGTASLAAVLVLSLLGGMAGITIQWRRAEAARQNASASELESQEVLIELIHSKPLDHGYRVISTDIDALQKTEAHCRNLLAKNPEKTPLRIALTEVYGGLSACYAQRGRDADAEASLRQARALWESLATEDAGDPISRNWLATTYSWQPTVDLWKFFDFHQRAEAIWQRLADEQPNNLDFMRRIWSSRMETMALVGNKAFQEACLRPIEESRAELQQLVRRSPTDRILRKQLALRYFLLGEIYAQESSTSRATSAWRESCEQYEILTKERPDDLLDTISLAIDCSKLIHGQPDDPNYLRAIALLEQAGARLKLLIKEQPGDSWLRNLLLEDYCYLTVCHSKGGQPARADETSNECVKLLTASHHNERLEPVVALNHATTLIEFGEILREAKKPVIAKRLTRQGAAVCSELAAYHLHDFWFLHDLARTLTYSSALANRLGEPALALEQAELSRRIIEDWNQAAPQEMMRDETLAATWERIAKAYWSSGERGQALTAFRESAATAKLIFDRDPSRPAHRAELSRCYDHLFYYCSFAGDLRGAAAAIRDRNRLWPGNAEELGRAADEFNVLAQRVAAHRGGHLSREDQAERDGYLAESRRARQAAEAASRQAPHDLRVER